jgi:hypothetical protein
MAGAGKEATRSNDGRRALLRIIVISILVEDQDKALGFYTGVLGFVKKTDVPLGKFRWLTVVSSENPDGVELLLEPNENPAARTFQKALFEQGIRSRRSGSTIWSESTRGCGSSRSSSARRRPGWGT